MHTESFTGVARVEPEAQRKFRHDLVGATMTGEHDYRWQDVVHYALAVGAGPEDVALVYEKFGPRVLPTFAVVPTFPVVVALNQSLLGDALGALHLRQRVTLERPIPPSGRLVTRGVIEGVYDSGSMASSVVTTTTWDSNGHSVFTTEWTVAFMRDGGFGGARPPAHERIRMPRRVEDFQVIHEIAPAQPLMYRLLGDHNPIHVDPEIAAQAGFARPIVHGLCTYGAIALAALRTCAAGDPEAVQEIRGEFRKPVFAGERIITRGWREGREVVTSSEEGTAGGRDLQRTCLTLRA